MLYVRCIFSKLLLLLVVSLLASSAIADSGLHQIRVDHLDFEHLPVIELEQGQQGDLEMDPSLRNLGQGLAPVYLYRLPDYAQPRQLYLTTIVKHKTIFYPVVVLLSADYKPVQVINTPVHLRRITQTEISSSMPIVVTPQEKYLLITTNPAYFGEQLSYQKRVTSMVREFDGMRVNYVPVTTGVRDVSVVIASSGRLALSVPNEDP